jgi:hypothetical protein
MHKMGYIQRVASPFTPPDGLIGPAVLVPTNGCPPPMVATVTEKPCTYICIGITLNTVAITQYNKQSKQAYHGIYGTVVVHAIVYGSPVSAYIGYMQFMYMV